MRGVWVALMVGAVATLSLAPADAKCGARGRGGCGHRLHVVHYVARSADVSGTEIRSIAFSQIAMAKKQLDMADAAVTRAKQEQDMATEAITRAKQEQDNAAQAMERTKREIEQMKARAERDIADAKARADAEIAEAKAQAERKVAAQLTEASRLRQTAVELQEYLTQKIGEEKKLLEDVSSREREAEQKIKDADANIEDANARQHAADEQMQAVQEERRRHDDRLRELLDVATKLINQTASKKPES